MYDLEDDFEEKNWFTQIMLISPQALVARRYPFFNPVYIFILSNISLIFHLIFLRDNKSIESQHNQAVITTRLYGYGHEHVK